MDDPRINIKESFTIPPHIGNNSFALQNYINATLDYYISEEQSAKLIIAYLDQLFYDYIPKTKPLRKTPTLCDICHTELLLDDEERGKYKNKESD